MSTRDLGFGTRAVHAGGPVDAAHGGVVPGPAVATTFARRDAATAGEFVYSRTANPSVARLEAQVGALEGGHAVAFGSGMAAITAVLEALASPGHVVATRSLYHGTRDAFRELLPARGIEMTPVDTSDAAALEAALRPDTRLVYVETPTNPLVVVTPLRPIVEIARAHGCTMAVDATFASPVLLRPLELGADVSVHSVTKVLGGHSDLTAGVAVCADPDLAARLARIRTLAGSVLSPFDAFLAERGVKTLHVRVPAMCANAGAVARFLAGHPAVTAVHYPGLHTALPEMAAGGFVCSFELTSPDAARGVADRLRVFTLATSLGGVESLAEWRRAVDDEAPPGLIRLSVGIEDEADLLADLEQALGSV